LDTAFIAVVLAGAIKLGGAKAFLKQLLEGMRLFPMHYVPVFNWRKDPMNKFVAFSTWAVGIYFLIKTYVVERGVVQQAHKKYAAHNNKLAVALHGAGSALETSIGALACCFPNKHIFTKVASALAINNVVTGVVLTPGVFGINT